MNRLLTDDEVLDICKKAIKDGVHRPPEICKAQDAKTLKAVGEWLNLNVASHIAVWDHPWHKMIESFKRGEMPVEVKLK